MKVKVCCIIALVSYMFLMGIAQVTAQSESKDQLIKFYNGQIEKKISNCKAKTVLNTSRSVNLQQEADLASKKFIFFTTNKNMLINEMIEQEIGYKPYKVEYYLNQRFNEMCP